MKKIIIKKIILLLIIITIAGCGSKWPNTYNLSRNQNINLWVMFENLGKESDLTAKFNISNQILNIFRNAGKYNESVLFFGELSEKADDIKIKSLYYYLLSEIYWEFNKDVSIFYMTKISHDFYDFKINESPVGYLIAMKILNSNADYSLKTKMYDNLLLEFTDYIDVPTTLFELSKLQKANFDLVSSIRTLEKLVKLSPNFSMSEEKSSIGEIKNEIDLYYINKDWAYISLEDLIVQIKTAINTKNIKLLYSLISKMSFEVKVFQKSSTEIWTFEQLAIYKIWSNDITFADKFEDFSTEDTVYLKTDNWNIPMMRTLYFGFNKIDYPYDNKINGLWTWNGIYCGTPY